MRGATDKPRRLVSLLAVLVALAAAGCDAGGQQQGQQTQTVTIDIGRPSQAGPGGATEPEGDAESPPSVAGAETCEGAREATTEDKLREAEIAIRCMTNAVRRERGRSELEFDERLARAAATRSNDMVEQQYFAHQGPDGGNVRRAARRAGYVPENRSWLLGENIGWAPEGQATPARIMRAWLDSPTHRANILAEHYTEIGVGAIAGVPTDDAEPGATYTQIFGVTGEAAREAQTG